MITENFYNTRMLETFKLLGTMSKANLEMAHAAYNRIKLNYEDTDLDGALESIMQSDFPKINFPILLRCLNAKRSIRFEEKAKADRDTGEETVRNFWNMETKADCLSRNCRTCPHLAGRCDTIAKHTLEAIKIMINRQWKPHQKDESFQEYYTVMRKEQHEHNGRILDELDRQFPGAGFGVNYDLQKKQVYTREELKHLYAGKSILMPTGNNKPSQGSFIPELPDA